MAGVGKLYDMFNLVNFPLKSSEIVQFENKITIFLNPHHIHTFVSKLAGMKFNNQSIYQ